MADESTVLGVRMTPHQERVYRLAAERLAALHAAMCDRDTTAGGDREWARNMIHAALREPDDPRPVPFAEGSAASVAQRLDAEGRVTPDRPDERTSRPATKADQADPVESWKETAVSVKVTRAGWFNFEGFGRPFEGWYGLKYTRWMSAGRAFTRRGAEKKAATAAMRDMEILDG